MDISAAKHSINIIDIISQHVSLQRTGKDYTGLCPFHSEKTPSFTVSPAKQIYHCFGCGAGGDVIEFIQQIHGCDFKQACAHLGIELENAEPVRTARVIKQAARRKSQLRRQARHDRIKREVETWAYWYESILLSLLDGLQRITPDNLDRFAVFVRNKSKYQYHLAIIAIGNEDDLYELWAEQAGHKRDPPADAGNCAGRAR